MIEKFVCLRRKFPKMLMSTRDFGNWT